MTEAQTESEPVTATSLRDRARSELLCEEPGVAIAEAPSPTFEPNRILRWIYTRFFRHMRVDDRWSAVVRQSAARGTVVYCMRAISVLDFLCLDYLLKRYRLPLVRFVNDLGSWMLEPFGRGRRLRRARGGQPESLTRVLHDQQSALLFLRRPPSLGETPKGHGLDGDLIRTLVEQQRKLERPILIVPQTFVWTKRPPNKKPTVFDLLFGPSEWPGRVRVFLQFLLNYRNAQLRSGEPFDVAAFLAEHQDLTDAEAADRIRYALLRRMERERQIVLGPAKKTASRIRAELLRSPRIRKHIEAAAREQHKPVEVIEAIADRDLRKLCAMLDPNAIALFARFLDWVFTRIYDGLVVDHEGLERVREAARRGPLILLPSHKSHVDYLVLSYVLGAHGISVPLIAAGDNLSFFPLGPFLRRSGAFFIRRSFQGRKLYTALVDAYLRKILVEGFNVEFFMEGGRSRTGKLLPPKLGLLSMVVDAGLRLPSVELNFVPISVGYDRIVEERSYTHELGGGEKQPESVGGLLRTSKVLRARYGRLYIQFGQVFSLQELLGEAAPPRPDSDSRALRPPERRALIQRIAHRVTYEINRVTIATPAALVASALLSHRRRGMRHDELLDRCAELLVSLKRAGARIASPALRDDAALVPSDDPKVVRALLREDAIDETLALFTEAKLVDTQSAGGERIHSLPDLKRLGLEYHKNTILHFFVPSALISTALSLDAASPLAESELRERVARLSKLFKYEFMYRADAPFDAIFDAALESMLAAREIVREGDRIRVGEGPMVSVYAAMVRTYFESYVLAVRALRRVLDDGSIKRKDWLKQTLALGQKMFLAGEIELRESICGPKLESALNALRDFGLVKLSADTIDAGPELTGAPALEAFEQRIAKYLR